MFKFILGFIQLLAENGFNVNIENRKEGRNISFGFDKDKVKRNPKR